MEARALCIRLILSASMLLVVSSADVHIVPSRLQLFEYQSVSFSCQGADVSPEWWVKNIKVNISTCEKSTSLVNCTNRNAVVSDSGEYWCEGPGGERSNAVTITVSGGSVILESPVLPVKEGEAVTLSCRSRKNVSNPTAGFFRDGHLIENSSTGTMTIQSVSKAHGGLYMCNISGVGESPQSPLTVRGNYTEVNAVTGKSTLKATTQECSYSSAKPLVDGETDSLEPGARGTVPKNFYYLLLWVVVAVVLVLQLLVIGLLQWKKQLLLLEIQLSNPKEDLNALVKKDKKKTSDEVPADAADNSSVCLETNHSRKPPTERDEDEPQCFPSSFSDDNHSNASEVIYDPVAPPQADEVCKYSSM